MNSKSELGGRIPSLDGLRALSIMLVLVGHSAETLPESTPSWFKSLWLFFAKGSLGVDVFFVISGFLITTLLMWEFNTTGAISLRNFYFRRVLRIFPAFYFYIFVICILNYLGMLDLSRTTIISAALYLWNYKHYWDHSRSDSEWFLGHFWTLAVEEQFYLFWPLAVARFRKVNVLIWIAIGLILLEPPVRLLCYFFDPFSRPQNGIMFHTTADVLMFGCAGALLFPHERFQRILDTLDRWRAPIVAMLVLFVLSPTLQSRYHAAYSHSVGLTLDSLCILCVVLWAIRHAGSHVGRLLNSRIFVHVGIISYSLYLWQQLFLTARNTSLAGSFPLNLVVTFAAAEFSYFAIERPFLGMRRRAHSPLERVA